MALHYQPVSALALRASYGTGFLPPEPNQILARRVVNNTGSSFIDPRRGNATYAASTLINGGNPDLAPEQSKSWSAGLVLTPLRESLGLRLSVDYTRVEKTDNIANLQAQVLVDNEGLFPDRVIRGPNLPTDLPGWAGPIVELNISSVNTARAWVEAYDFQLDYRLETSSWGSFDAYVIGTRQTRFETQLLPGAPIEDSVGIAMGVTAGSPLKLKAQLQAARLARVTPRRTLAAGSVLAPSLMTASSVAAAIQSRVSSQLGLARARRCILNSAFGLRSVRIDICRPAEL